MDQASTETMNNDNTTTKQKKGFTIETKSRDNGMPGGHLGMNDDVVATIAAMAAKQIKGIHALGKSKLISFGEDLTHGVEAEVGKKQAAFDLDVVLEYGCDVREVAGKLRQAIAAEVNRMAGREVVEVNINVIDLHLPEQDTNEADDKPRVI